MTISNVGALPVVVLAADTVDRVAGDADLWTVAEALVAADVGALAVLSGDDVSGIVSARDLGEHVRRGVTSSTAMQCDGRRLDRG